MAGKNKYCRNCGTPAMPETKFCANCGAEFEEEPQISKPSVCKKCGATLKDGEKFCCNCGCRIESCSTSQNPNNLTSGQETQSEAPTSDVTPDSTDAPAAVTILPNKKKRKSKKPKILGITALFLVICILFTGFCQPGFFIKNEKRKAPITGVSAIKPPSKGKRVKPETATVGYENNRAEFDSGVIVDFGAYNLQADEKLSVRSLGAKNDGDYEAVLYDFGMGKTDRFPFVAEITLPYDPSWGEEVFVQYYDKSTKQWSIIWSEPDGKGNVTFWTDHFSIYATFRKMVQGENGWGDYADSRNNSSLFVPTADNKTPISFEQLTPTTRCMLDVAALAKYIRNNSVDMGAVKPGAKDTAGLESAINILNNTGSFGAAYLDALDFVGGTSYFGPLTDVLGYVGYAFTVSKILMQAYRTGDFLQAVIDHQLDLAGIALSVGAKVTTGATATCLNLAAFVLLMKGVSDSFGQYVDLLGAENKTEYAYRLFTTMHLTYLPKSDRISVKYGKNDYEKLNQLWQSTEISLRATRPTIGNPTYSNWEVTFESIFKKNKNQPEKVVPAINKLLDMYCNAFWQLEDSNSKTYRKFLKETRSGTLSLDKMIDVYKKPTDEERAVYTARLKNDLIVWLSPMINEYAKKAYIEMLNLTLRNAYALQDELNKTVTFTIVDAAPKKNGITINSGMKPYHPPKNLSNIRMRQFRTDKELWKFTKENKYTVKCTPYAFMAVGMPKFIDFYYAEEDTPVTIKIAPTFPNTYIPMGENEYPTLAEIEGVYADGKTVVVSAEGKEMFSGLLKSLEDAGWRPSDGSGADSSDEMPFSLVVTGKKLRRFL